VWLTQLVGVKEVAVIGDDAMCGDMERIVWDTFRPDVVIAVGDGSDSPIPLLADRPVQKTTLAYVCRNLVCDLPVNSADALADQITIDRPV